VKHFLVGWTTNDGYVSSQVRAMVAKLGSSANCLPNVMILRHRCPAHIVRKKLLPVLRTEDGLFIAELTGNFAWCGPACHMTDRKAKVV
jgi:hypothetical protein